MVEEILIDDDPEYNWRGFFEFNFLTQKTLFVQTRNQTMNANEFCTKCQGLFFKSLNVSLVE
jgi:hypothetical protein